MLERVRALLKYQRISRHAGVGRVDSLYFDRHWVVRFLVADTGTWLTGRQVMRYPYAPHAANRNMQDIAGSSAKQPLADRPRPGGDGPRPRVEEPYHGYLWPQHWSGMYTGDSYLEVARELDHTCETSMEEPSCDSHLHSTSDVSGYHLQGTDGEIGHVEDFIFDDDTWAIRYLVIDTGNGRPGRKVLVAPQWADRVSWADAQVYVPLSRAATQASPAYAEETALTRDYEISLHGHYGRPGYWVGERGAVAGG